MFSCWSTISVRFCGCRSLQVLLLCCGCVEQCTCLSAFLMDFLTFSEISMNLSKCSYFYDFFLISRPDLPRPIRVNTAIPIIFIILCVILVLLPSLEAPENLVAGIVITLLGIPVYYLGLAIRNNKSYSRMSQGLVTFCQIFFSTIFVDEEEKAV